MQEAKPSSSLITLSWAHSRRLHRLPVPAVRRAVPPPVSRLMDANDARGASPPRTPILCAVRVTLERWERAKPSATIVSRSGAPAERLPRVLPPVELRKTAPSL
jgi:hypothetical protein